MLDSVQLPAGELAYACMLGGVDRRTLYICAARTAMPQECRTLRTARVVATEVDVAGAGWP